MSPFHFRRATVAALIILTSTAAFAAKSPQAFVKDAIQGDDSEIALGQLAKQKAAGDQKLLDFANTLVTDHTTAKQQATSVAKDLGVTAPESPTSAAQDEKKKLSELSGADFTREFANYMVQDHQKDIQEFQDEANASNGPASELARKQLPVLKKHLQLARDLQQGSGAATGSHTAALNSTPTQERPDQWRASKLIGVPIYGPDDKKVGGITDVLISKEGKAGYVVVGVGGFLGIGQKDVAIPYDQVTFSSQPVQQNGSGNGNSKSGATSATGGSSSGGAGGGGGQAGGQRHSDAYPDHGTIQLTADQLKNAPSFKFAQ